MVVSKNRGEGLNRKEKNLLLSLFRQSVDSKVRDRVKRECLEEGVMLGDKLCSILGIKSYSELGHKVLDSQFSTMQEYVKREVLVEGE